MSGAKGPGETLPHITGLGGGFPGEWELSPHSGPFLQPDEPHLGGPGRGRPGTLGPQRCRAGLPRARPPWWETGGKRSGYARTGANYDSLSAGHGRTCRRELQCSAASAGKVGTLEVAFRASPHTGQSFRPPRGFPRPAGRSTDGGGHVTLIPSTPRNVHIQGHGSTGPCDGDLPTGTPA